MQLIINSFYWLKSQEFHYNFLLLTLIFLPVFEAPKNIFALLFIVSWVFYAIKTKKWGGKWGVIDSIFLIWIIADIIAGVNAIFFHDMSANGSKDIIRFVLIGWVISRSNFSINQFSVLFFSLMTSTLIGLFYSYLNCSQGGVCVELNSVGHVNHTAIFTVIIYAILTNYLVLNFEKLNFRNRIPLITAIFFLGYVIIDTRSRSAAGLCVLVTLIPIIYRVRSLKHASLFLLALTISGSVLIYNPPMVVDKYMSGTTIFGESPRQKIRNFSYYVYQKDPIFGIGFGNFINMDLDDVRDIIIEDKGSLDQNQYLPYAHPHNLYYTYLVGGGLLVFSILIWFWIYIFTIIWRIIKNKGMNDWMLFNGFAVILINLGIGWVNTTFAVENAILSMLILGMLIQTNRRLILEFSNKHDPDRNGWLGFWPGGGLKAIFDPENARITEFLLEQREALPKDSFLLDAGAGKRPYKYIFKGLNYESTDMPGGFYEQPHDFECELHNIPKDDNTYDVVVLTQVLEHVPNPQATLFEICRVLKPNGKLLLSVPLNGPLHGEPWHFFQFTHYGLNQLAIETGFHIADIEKVGGAFWLIGKRLPVAFKKLLKQYDPLRAKKRNQNVFFAIIMTLLLLPIWFILYLPSAYVIRPLFYWFDYLDREKSFTTGYTAVFMKNQ